MSDWSGIVVSKPWGAEFEVYNNNQVSVWQLNIKKGHRTSFHAHPNKTTGLIVVDGEAEVRFFKNTFSIGPIEKFMLHPHVFHQTRALTDVTVLEVETPPDKLDLVRLTDDYARDGQPYEGLDQYSTGNGPSFGEWGDVGCCRYWKQALSRRVIEAKDPDRVFVFLRGGMAGSKGQKVVVPGHIVWSQDLRRLLEVSEPEQDTLAFEIWKPA